MARIYANENFPLPAVAELRSLGHDVLTVQEVGRIAEKDEDVLVFATNQQRIVLTLNRRHFVKLHELYTSHCGIIVCSPDNDSIGLAERIHRTICNSEDLNGRLMRVNRPGNL
ncbi:MAG: DUF5615 family PIN-like protein [Armatimonadetes bacterium]|nr:DUF5615 family PIN-like protein [Armatimonadota bacterium]